MLGLVINIFLHVFILFIFLTILYFTIISVTETNTVKTQLNKLIDGNLSTIFSKIKSHLSDDQIQLAEAFAQHKMTQYGEPSDKVIQNNQQLLINAVIIICVIFVCLSMVLVYFKFVKSRNLGLTYILTENIFIFLIIGILEFAFFWYIVQNYIPLYPQTAEITILTHLISYLNKN